jgi:GNAT superfamily N-acetyltransferase
MGTATTATPGLTLRLTLDPELTPALLEQLTGLWAEVADAGGAVGFADLPVDRADVRAEVERHAAAVAEGRTRLLAGFGADGRLAATAFLSFNAHRLQRHWAWLYTVMIHPSLQGGGHGRALLAAAESHARDLGLEALRLTCRGGMGLEGFYGRCGYKEVGRVPGGLRVSAGDYRDDIMMWLPLT